MVSTHSRPKAAGLKNSSDVRPTVCFNTQPPEGGWNRKLETAFLVWGFNTQPPEGGWFQFAHGSGAYALFQHTAARRRLGHSLSISLCGLNVSTHSRPKAAGFRHSIAFDFPCMFQHTAARRRLGFSIEKVGNINRFNTQPPEGGWAACR